MNEQTENHLNQWLKDQGLHHNEAHLNAIKAGMVITFDTDPDYYSNVSWWRVYDQAERNSRFSDWGRR